MRLPILKTIKYTCVDGSSFDSEEEARNHNNKNLSDCVINKVFFHNFEIGTHCLLKNNKNNSFYLVKVIDEVISQRWEYSESLGKIALHTYNTLVVKVLNSNPAKVFNINQNTIDLLSKVNYE
jgi:hypothetical protein